MGSISPDRACRRTPGRREASASDRVLFSVPDPLVDEVPVKQTHRALGARSTICSPVRGDTTTWSRTVASTHNCGYQAQDDYQPLRSRPLHGDTAYRVRRSQSTPEMAPPGSHCWGGDGSLLFPRRLCQRSTPCRRWVPRGCISKSLTPSMAFVRGSETRLPVDSLRSQNFRRGRLRFMLWTAGLHPPEEGSTPRFGAQVSPDAGGLLQRCLGASFGRTCTG
jgi:hypothetical protein